MAWIVPILITLALLVWTLNPLGDTDATRVYRAMGRGIVSVVVTGAAWLLWILFALLGA